MVLDYFSALTREILSPFCAARPSFLLAVALGPIRSMRKPKSRRSLERIRQDTGDHPRNGDPVCPAGVHPEPAGTGLLPRNPATFARSPVRFSASQRRGPPGEEGST
jgi:hypothetical protein